MGSMPLLFCAVIGEQSRYDLLCSGKKIYEKVCRKLVHREYSVRVTVAVILSPVVGRYTSNSTVSPGFSLLLHFAQWFRNLYCFRQF